MSPSNKILTAAWIVMAATPLAAQPRWAQQKFSVTLGGGLAVPGMDLRGLMANSTLINAGIGYRLTRHLQIDAGMDAVSYAAGVDFSQPSIIGNLRVRDSEYMIPLGARAILPIGRVELFGGGGAAYLNYSEEVEVPGSGSDSSYNCTVCTSRGGWGYYATAGAMVAVDRRHWFWLGVQTRAFRAGTSGDPLGSLPSSLTKDQWVNTAAVFSFRFP